jgi:hypothetical protein
MSRDSGAHGVQVVGGSNPPCPTKQPLSPIHHAHDQILVGSLMVR